MSAWFAASVILVFLAFWAGDLNTRIDRLDNHVAQACHAGPPSAAPRP